MTCKKPVKNINTKNLFVFLNFNIRRITCTRGMIYFFKTRTFQEYLFDSCLTSLIVEYQWISLGWVFPSLLSTNFIARFRTQGFLQGHSLIKLLPYLVVRLKICLIFLTVFALAQKSHSPNHSSSFSLTSIILHNSYF